MVRTPWILGFSALADGAVEEKIRSLSVKRITMENWLLHCIFSFLRTPSLYIPRFYGHFPACLAGSTRSRQLSVASGYVSDFTEGGVLISDQEFCVSGLSWWFHMDTMTCYWKPWWLGDPLFQEPPVWSTSVLSKPVWTFNSCTSDIHTCICE